MDRTEKEKTILKAILARRDGKRVVRCGQIIVGNIHEGYITQDGHLPDKKHLDEYLNSFHVIEKPFVILEYDAELETL